MLRYEQEFIAKGYSFIAGADEAGRGPLAGPVAAAAVILPLGAEVGANTHNRHSGGLIEGIDDSKKLTEKRREELYERIINAAIGYSCVMIEPQEIDKINILNAALKAVRLAIERLKPAPQALITDFLPFKQPFLIPHQNLVKGDSLSYSAAAASIIAKVRRDRLMCEYAKQFPEYGFERHKGYGTKQHFKAIEKFGLTPIHRRSFCREAQVLTPSAAPQSI